MSKNPNCFSLSDKSPFHKHKGRTFHWILLNDPDYFRWLDDNFGLRLLEGSESVTPDGVVINKTHTVKSLLHELNDRVTQFGSDDVSVLILYRLLYLVYDEGRNHEHQNCNPGFGPSLTRSWENTNFRSTLLEIFGDAIDKLPFSEEQ